MKINDITLAKAHDIWKRASKFDPKVYDIMQFIIKYADVRLLINRNPTLNYYSMLLMKIREVKPDDRDYSLSVNMGLTLNFLNCWNQNGISSPKWIQRLTKSNKKVVY